MSVSFRVPCPPVAPISEVRTNQVSVLEVEAIELIACLLGVVHVLVDNKRCTLRVVRDALANLPARKRREECQQTNDRHHSPIWVFLPNRTELAEKVKQLLCGHVVASGAKSATLR